MASLRSASVVMAAALVGTGCALVSGLSTLDVDPGAGAGDASADRAADAIDGALFDAPPLPLDAGCGCLGTLPPGFAPALYGAADGKCPKELQDESVFVGPQSFTATGPCSCGCTMSGCTGGTVRLYDTAGCGGQLGSFVPNGGCQTGVVGNPGAVNSVRLVPATPPTCVSNLATFPSASSGKSRLCTGSATPSSCALVCQASGLQACIVASGDVACPNGMNKQVVAASITDTRTCTGCSCSVSPQATCMVELQFYTDLSCAVATSVPYDIVDGCNTVTIPSANVIAKNMPVGSCTPLGGAATGGTSPVGVRTVCCK